ncbi:MAG: hypothetical protein ACU0BS_05100 [Hasllibacter sp.]
MIRAAAAAIALLPAGAHAERYACDVTIRTGAPGDVVRVVDEGVLRLRIDGEAAALIYPEGAVVRGRVRRQPGLLYVDAVEGNDRKHHFVLFVEAMMFNVQRSGGGGQDGLGGECRPAGAPNA